MTVTAVRRALLSVSDKTGVVDLARGLVGLSVELISTGGTRKALAEAGLPVKDISEVTGFPEILDGRVKTLHPRIHGGILAIRDNPEHQATLQAQGIVPIDLVVCNLYPFEATLARPGSRHEDIIENIDIGGPSMVRSAAKNYHDVAIVTDPIQYPAIIEELRANHGSLSLHTREHLAAGAFMRTAGYDRAITTYFASRVASLPSPPLQERADGGEGAPPIPFPSILDLRLEKRQALRYGENPHQQAAFYVESNSVASHASVATAEMLHGKELSFNNILDLDS